MNPFQMPLNVQITNYHTLAADFSSTRGNHSIRFGGEYRLSASTP